MRNLDFRASVVGGLVVLVVCVGASRGLKCVSVCVCVCVTGRNAIL